MLVNLGATGVGIRLWEKPSVYPEGITLVKVSYARRPEAVKLVFETWRYDPNVNADVLIDRKMIDVSGQTPGVFYTLVVSLRNGLKPMQARADRVMHVRLKGGWSLPVSERCMQYTPSEGYYGFIDSSEIHVGYYSYPYLFDHHPVVVPPGYTAVLCNWNTYDVEFDIYEASGQYYVFPSIVDLVVYELDANGRELERHRLRGVWEVRPVEILPPLTQPSPSEGALTVYGVM